MDAVATTAEAAFAEAQGRALARHEAFLASRFVHAEGQRVHALVGGEGPPLLLVHGAVGSAVTWAPVLGHLAARHRVIAVDLPGAGLSSKPDYRTVSDLRAHAATFVGAVLDAFGVPRARVVGNGLGGWFATAFALARPERVDKLVLVGAPTGTSRWMPSPLRLLATPGVSRLAFAGWRRPPAARTRETLGRLFVADAARVSEELVECATLGAALPGAATSRRTLLGALCTPRGLAPRAYLRGEFGRLSVPVRFVWGALDAFEPPASGRALAGIVPGASFTEVPEAGNMPWLDRPGDVAAALVG